MIDRVRLSHKFLSSTQSIAILSLLIACCVSSLTPICVKWSEQEISSIATVFNRFFFGALVFSLSSGVLLNPQKNNAEATISRFYPTKIILLLLGAGTCAAANQAFWALSLTQTNVGNSSLLHSLSPLFTTVLAWLFLQRSFDRQFLIGMAIAIGGSVIIGIGDFQIALTKLQGDGFALISAIFFAVYLLMVEQLRISLSAGTVLFWRCVLGTVLLLPILLLNGDRLIPASEMGWLAIAGLVLTFVIGHGLLAYTLKVLSASLVAVVLLIDPFLSSLQAWIFFGEKLNLLEGISFAIVILGVYLVISSRDRQSTP